MQKGAGLMNRMDSHIVRRALDKSQKVVIVNGNTEILELLESVLDPGHYDIVFVEEADQAYSQIKRVQPHLVILCVNIEDLDGFQLLSMLKLDDDTAAIPVLTYTTEGEGQDAADQFKDLSEDEQFMPARTAFRMN
jgi:two-component system, OmpR family, alkaline phosphatase synthesis response regulator PhoP